MNDMGLGRAVRECDQGWLVIASAQPKQAWWA